MRIDHVVDERLDPYLASSAAARLLAENHEDLGEWPLALTAYNHGVAGMRRAVSRLGTTDMGEIAARYQGRTFGFARRNRRYVHGTHALSSRIRCRRIAASRDAHPPNHDCRQ